MIPICGGGEIIRTRISGLLSPVEILSGAAWCEKHLTLYDPQHQLSGPVDFSRYPFLREPVESMCDPAIRLVCLCFSAQMLKTTGIEMAAGNHVALRQVPLVWAMDSRDNARKFSQGRWQPFIDLNPSLARLKPANRDLYKTLEQHFTSGALYFVGSNSPGALASTPAGRVIMDEVDKYPQFSGREADAASLLGERLAGSYSGNTIMASTPTYYDGPIWQSFLQLDQRLLYVPCPHCREYITLVNFGGLKWDPAARRDDGGWDIPMVRATAYYECPKCGGHIQDGDKPAMMRAGEWMATNPHPSAEGRSYRINRIYSVLPSGNFGEIASKHLLAGKDPAKRQNFSNSVLAEPYEDESDKHEVAEVLAHAENYPATPLPRGVLLLTCGVDVQKGRENDPDRPPRIEAELVGWGREEETWGIEHAVFRCGVGTGSIENQGENSVWAKLDRWLMRQLVTEDGRVLPVACTLIDSGWMPETVYGFCESRLARNIFPCKGRSPGRPGDPIVSLAQHSNVRRVPVHMVSRWTGNLFVYGKLQIKQPGPHYMHFPNDPARGYDLKFFEQLVAERLSKRRVGGQMVAKWVDDGKQTEALACRRYASAAYARLNADLEAMARQAEFIFEAREASQKKAGPVDGAPKVQTAPLRAEVPLRSSVPLRGGDGGGCGLRGF